MLSPSSQAITLSVDLAGNGHCASDLVLFLFASDGQLLAEQLVAWTFFDAGQSELTKSFICDDSLLIRA